MFPTSTFIPQLYGEIRSASGFTVTGRPNFGSPRPVGLSVVRDEAKSQPTSIRTDKSGSQGRADEVVVKARLLIENLVEPKMGDLISYAIGTVKRTYRVDGVYPRLDMDGLINHFQVDAERWE